MDTCQYCRNVATSTDRTGPICLDCEDSDLFNEEGAASQGDHMIIGDLP